MPTDLNSIPSAEPTSAVPPQDAMNVRDARPAADSETLSASLQAGYARFWEEIRRHAPQSVLLRGPARLQPIQASSEGDLDILVSTGAASIAAYLSAQGFHRVFKPQVYLQRFRLRAVGAPLAYTVDLYLAERWGSGFRLSKDRPIPAPPRLACLLHAVLDGKGTKYFEREQNEPPWAQSVEGDVKFGPVGRGFWRARSTSLLTLYLLFKGVIRLDRSMFFRSLSRRITYRVWQMVRKTGLEVALLGVDGTGKTSLAQALARLPVPVRIVYMGPHDHLTRIMRFAERYRVPRGLRQLAFRYDLLVRRLYGWLLARRGWIVVYDRHPSERLDPDKTSLRHRAKNLMDRIYAWPVDMTFWLTGDYSTIYLRKEEYPPEYLEAIDRRFSSVLERYAIPFEKIDVTKHDLDSVLAIIRCLIYARYHERISQDRLPSILKASPV